MQFQNGYGVSEATNQHHITQPHQPQFQVFLHQHHQPLHSDPFALNFRPPTDTNNHTGLLAGGAFPAYVPPPPSVVLPPQSLWKCEGIETAQDCTQFGSKPKSENRLSHSPESGGEVYEAQWGGNPESQMTRRTREVSPTCTAKRKKKNKNKFCTEEELKVLSGLIEARLVAHQESLQRRFTAAVDQMERDRKEREDAWRAADVEIYRAHVAARARDQALASAREALIVSYIEKMTGEKMDLPMAETVNGSLTGLGRPGSKAHLEDDGRPPDSYLNSGDVDCEKNEMLEALLEFKERNHQPHLYNKLMDHHHHEQGYCDDDA